MLQSPFTYKPTVKVSLFSLFLLYCFHGNFGLNQVVSMRHFLSLFMCDLTLIKGKIKSSSYGLLTYIALQVEYLAPGQNCITCIICTKGKSLKEKERVQCSYTHELHGNFMAKLEQEEKETQKKLSKTKHLLILLFSLFLFSRFHGNFGLNQMVCMRHLIFFCLCVT